MAEKVGARLRDRLAVQDDARRADDRGDLVRRDLGQQVVRGQHATDRERGQALRAGCERTQVRAVAVQPVRGGQHHVPGEQHAGTRFEEADAVRRVAGCVQHGQ